jgi:hypothetical protein
MMPITAIMPSRMNLPASGCGELDSVEELYKITVAPLEVN